MTGKRQMDECAGWGTGRPASFGRKNWLIRWNAKGRDVGVLLLAEDPAASVLELVYMGLIRRPVARAGARKSRGHAVAIGEAKRTPRRVVLAVECREFAGTGNVRPSGLHGVGSTDGIRAFSRRRSTVNFVRRR